MSFWKTTKQRGGMFVTKPVKKGIATGKRKGTPTFWRGKKGRR